MAAVVWLLLLLRLLGLRMVLFEADVPGQAADGRHGLELVDDVSWDEVNVIVTELDADVADAFPPQLVELGLVHPLDALWGDSRVSWRPAPPAGHLNSWISHLRHRRLVQIQLQTLDHFMEIASLETHHVFGYPRLVGPGTKGIEQPCNLLLLEYVECKFKKAENDSHHSPKCTAFSTPTAAVLCQSKVWPTWSAWALVRSSNRTSLGSLALGR